MPPTAESACSAGQVDVDRSEIAASARLFKALGDERRLLLLSTVAANPGICACGLLDLFQMSQSTLSHHMKLLCEAGFVDCEKQGKWAHYRLGDRGRQGIESFMKTMWTPLSNASLPSALLPNEKHRAGE